MIQKDDELSQPERPEAGSLRPLRERVGITIQGSDTVDAIARIREAELAGVQQIWMPMDGAAHADLLTLFAAVATQTGRIRLGSAIIPTYPRHPLAIAQQALAVHDLAPGRLRLGMGPGSRTAIENWHGLSRTSPQAYLKEYLEVVRSVLWKGSINYHGTFFQVAFSSPRIAPVPLLISAVGPKAFRLAGEIADGALSAMCPIPYLLSSALPALRAGAEEKARPTPPVVAHVLVALSTDQAAVQAAARPLMHVVRRLSHFAQMFSSAGFAGAVDGDEADLDALTQTLVVSGNEATMQRRMQELLASGLDELQLQLVPVASEARERQQLLHLVGAL
jgi:alkanesulfonate monooxygenase SsuD/methylene tetrahydromethanopterin reductase-like flavin-dependent oxidoreductase (luciferase family)